MSKTLSNTLLRIAKQAQNRGGVASSIYLTQQHTDQLLAEMGMKRDRRCTRTPAVDRFNDVPVYPDREVSMVVVHDQAGEVYSELL